MSTAVGKGALGLIFSKFFFLLYITERLCYNIYGNKNREDENMANGCISMERILSKLDEYFGRNDYDGAERHLLYWLSDMEANNDVKNTMPLINELMGLYRKTGKKEPALECVNKALKLINEADIGEQVGAATCYLNCATVYKAFGMANEAISLFERARKIYESELEPSDARLGGLYNNMALALVDLGRYREARSLYQKAVSVMEQVEGGGLEVAITYLNMASAAEAEFGLLDGDEKINEYMDKAQILLDEGKSDLGYYAFVCEKCASVFGYYGRFIYEAELKERARTIYERP